MAEYGAVWCSITRRAKGEDQIGDPCSSRLISVCQYELPVERAGSRRLLQFARELKIAPTVGSNFPQALHAYMNWMARLGVVGCYRMAWYGAVMV